MTFLRFSELEFEQTDARRLDSRVMVVHTRSQIVDHE
jgi:hypothetical protein